MADPTSTVNDIATYLQTLTFGKIDPDALGVGEWLITKRDFAEDNQDRNIMVTTAGGAPPETASQTKNPTIDIFLRAGVDEAAILEAKALAILDALAYVDETRIAGGTMYNMIRSLQSEPFPMGRDKKRRSILLIKFQALRSTVNSAP